MRLHLVMPLQCLTQDTPHALPFLPALLVCSSTKSKVLLHVLFMLPESSSLGGTVEGGRSVSTSSSSSSRLGRVGFICAAHDTAFPAFSFTDLKEAAVCALSAFSFASRSLRVISADVKPATSASP
jgi:hypothetical protein